LTPVAVSDDELILSTSNLYTKDWVERRLTSDIHEAITVIAGRRFGFRIVFADEQNDSLMFETNTSVIPAMPADTAFMQNGNTENDFSYLQSSASSFSYGESPNGTPLTTQLNGESANKQPDLFTGQDQSSPAVSSPSSNESQATDQRMTFESFVIDEGANQLAFSTSVLVAKSPGYVINPLFIYGRSGLGKTHLLLSIRHYLEQHRPDLTVVYAQTNEMLSEYSFAATQGSFREFDLKYKTADVFLLDDVQRLENRPGTVSIVFDIFNQMKDANKQIVLSSDRPPLEINLEERFLSRFSSGVIADVQPLSAETKLTIVSNYLPYCCRRLDCDEVLHLIGTDVIEHIVSLSGSNIRELEGALNNLVITLKHDKARFQPITPEEAEVIVSNHFRHLAIRDIDVATIQQAVEKFFNVRHEDILSSRRSQEISYPRQVAMYLCRNMTNASLPQISKAFNKDHTAVLYAVNNIEKRRQLTQSVDSDVRHLMDVLTS